MPVVILQPTDGAEVTSPFVVAGRANPGARVRLSVIMEGGPEPVRVADTEVAAGPDGSFGFTVESGLRFSGARYRVMVTAVGPEGQAGTATVTVQER